MEDTDSILLILTDVVSVKRITRSHVHNSHKELGTMWIREECVTTEEEKQWVRGKVMNRWTNKRGADKTQGWKRTEDKKSEAMQDKWRRKRKQKE